MLIMHLQFYYSIRQHKNVAIGAKKKSKQTKLICYIAGSERVLKRDHVSSPFAKPSH